MLNFDAKKLNKAIDHKENNLSGENEELYGLGKKLSQTRLVDSEALEVDTFFAETLKEKLYYDWAQERKSAAPQKKSAPLFRYIGAACFTAAIIALVAYFGYFANFKNDVAPAISQNQDNDNQAPFVADNSLTAAISFTLGDVEIWEGDRWMPVVPGLEIGNQRQIRTGEDAKAILQFEDGSAMRIDENTHVILESADQSEIILQQIIGKSYSRVNKSSVLAYTVRSNNTETTAMGTAFTIEVTPEQNLKIKALESNVKISLIDPDTHIEQEVREGEEALVQYAEASVLPPVVNEIYPAELADEFIAWNRQQDIGANQPLGRLADLEPPSLAITNPRNGATIEAESIAIAGISEPGASIFVNNELAENKDGYFEQEFILADGDNIFEIKTVDRAGNETRAVIKIIRPQQTPTHVAAAEIAPTVPQKEAPTAAPIIKEAEKVYEAAEESPAGKAITLNGLPNDRGVYLTWIVDGFKPTYGFLILRSKNPGISYPGTESTHFPYSYGRRYFQPLIEPGRYYIKICEYRDDGSCGAYSNEITVDIK